MGAPFAYQMTGWGVRGAGLVLVRAGLFVAALALAACGATTPGPTVAAAPATPTLVTPSARPTRAPTSTRAQAATRTPDSLQATPSPSPTLEPLEPVATAQVLWPVSWSRDGRWLAYRTATLDEADQNPYEGTAVLPYGTFHFLDVQTGRGCLYPTDNADGLRLNLWHKWLPDGGLMTLDTAGEVVVLADPCAGETITRLAGQGQPPCLVTNPDSGQSCSPSGRRLGFSDETHQPHTTTITDTATGETVAVVTWPDAPDGVGHISGPLWVDDDRFILQVTDKGPMLVTLSAGAQVQPVAPTYFGVPGNNSQWVTVAPAPGATHAHWLLTEYAGEAGDGQLLLFHADNGNVERLDAVSAGFSADGRWLLLYDSRYNPTRVHPVDPAVGDLRTFTPAEDDASLAWSADLSRVATFVKAQPRANRPAFLRIYGMPAKTLLQEYALGPWNSGAPLWAPGGRHVAVAAYDPTNTTNAFALFVVALVEPAD